MDLFIIIALIALMIAGWGLYFRADTKLGRAEADRVGALAERDNADRVSSRWKEKADAATVRANEAEDRAQKLQQNYDNQSGTVDRLGSDNTQLSAKLREEEAKSARLTDELVKERESIAPLNAELSTTKQKLSATKGQLTIARNKLAALKESAAGAAA